MAPKFGRLIGADTETEIVNVGGGKTRAIITFKESYPFSVFKDVIHGITPSDPPLRFDGVLGNGLAGLDVTVDFDSATGHKEFSVSGSLYGIGVSGSATIDKDNNVIESKGFAGVQLIGGKKVAVLGIPYGQEGVVRLGVRVDNDGIAITAEGEASIGFLLGEIDVDASFEIIELIKFNDYCFLADTKIDMWDGSQKPIEKIEKNDLVKSFDDQGNLVSGTVTQTMVSKADQILDFHGVKVTLGHAYLSGDDETRGQFLTIIDILRSDGVIVDASGELIRAATNYPVGSREDKFIEIAYLPTKQDTQLKQGRIRAGTLLLMKDGSTASVLSCIEKAGYTLLDDGFVQKTGEEPEPLHWFGPLPKPEDYVLKRSQLTNEDVALVVH